MTNRASLRPLAAIAVAAAIAPVCISAARATFAPIVDASQQAPAPTQSGTTTPGGLVTLPSPNSPIVAFRLMFRVGSMHDPAGKEGLAALTGMMLGRGGSARRSYSDIIDALYPMAAEIDVNTDREVTVFTGQVHREKLADFHALVREMLLEPGFRQEDFERNREQLLAYLTTTLRSANDELLGLELIQQEIFENHPYGHSSAGTVQGLRRITLDDVRAFYKQQYTRRRLIAGVAGGYPDPFAGEIGKLAQGLPEGTAAGPVPAPKPVSGRNVTIYEKNTDSVGIHIGFPVAVNRAHPDYYALMVANSYLGEHRTFYGRLMQQLRGLRGFNYGDYSYIEHWSNPPGTENPPPNVPRQHQYFSVWVRPVAPANAHFALRNALAEVNRLIGQGLTEEDFKLTRDYLINYSKLWARSLSNRLGFHLDSRFYGTPYYIEEFEQRLRKLTVQQVNQAVKKHLQTQNFEAVLVAGNAAPLKTALEKDEPSPIKYENPVPPEVTQADLEIQALPLKPTSVRIVPVAEVFEK